VRSFIAYEVGLAMKSVDPLDFIVHPDMSRVRSDGKRQYIAGRDADSYALVPVLFHSSMTEFDVLEHPPQVGEWEPDE
jgi:hypothetical protein